MTRSIALSILAAISCASRDPTSAAADTGGAGSTTDTGVEPSTSEPLPGGASTGAGSTSIAGDTASSSGAPGDTTGAMPSGPDLPYALLRRDPYPRLVVEVDAVGGHEPYPQNPDRIATTLAQLVDKPGGVEVIADGVLKPVGADHAWTAEERFALGEARFDLALPPDTIAIHVMFVDGYASEDDATGRVTIGHAWANRQIMIYKQRITEGCQGLIVGDLTEALCQQTEFLLWQHELGHVLGLVEFGLPMQTDHRDPEHGPHDIDPACLMHWSYDGIDLLGAVLDELVMGAPPVELDAACLADLAAGRGR